MLSSAVCIFGNPGQANYAAGNTFQDALARHRTAMGEKAVTLDLGLLLDEGWVAERKHIQDRMMQEHQLLPLSQRELFAILDYYFDPCTVIGSPTTSQIVTGIQLPTLIRHAGKQIPDTLHRPLFRAMHQIRPGKGDLAETAMVQQNLKAVFEKCGSLEEAGAVISEALKAKLCKILGLDEKEKSVHDRMDSFGVDSLVALEIRNWLLKEVRADLAVYEILGDASLTETGLTAARKSQFSLG